MKSIYGSLLRSGLRGLLALGCSALTCCVNYGPPMLPPPPFGRNAPGSGIGAIQNLAMRIGNASGGAVARRVVYGQDPGPTCLIRGRGPAGVIEVNPRAAGQVPSNSWAFILGHEFAHQITGVGQRGATSPAIEQRMDLLGARYAERAGFRVADHVAWVLSRRDEFSPSHGSSHRRAEALARAYGIRPEQIRVTMVREGYLALP